MKKPKVIESPETSDYPLSCHIPEKERLRLFEHFLEVLVEYVSVHGVVEHLNDVAGWEDAFNRDYKDLITELLNPMEDKDWLAKFFEMALPRLVESDLGAKKVTIEW